jgi:hypothetical protein
MANIRKHKFIFICGLHRSGTSLLYKILKEQKNISGLSKTNVIEDEGQHVQTVYPPANKYGGPGRFGFNEASFLNQNSELITKQNQDTLFNEWSKYWDLKNEYLLEKSPPNLVRTLFLQEMFPNSYFITLFRHPIATSLATKKWSKTSHHSLIKHWLICHKQYLKDKPKLKHSLDIKYEDMVNNSEITMKRISKFLGVQIKTPSIEIKKEINNKYLMLWQKNKKNIFYKRSVRKAELEFEKEINKFGYSFINNL